ncbi:DUF1516 family protein [Pullulanibacillus sp. KACC 23026]|uniref:DUF1516 family protein n=1 Tax=Pullulanibacillus sp. KACC 23026 TaxID=3028315 RepID=UPI0023AF6FAC|nr:DUF1516 family protein [Pullulanibacillus sp. KACC 23026]WEG11957.1 DUF1516 family protein [Pullulanibacillus sp. KACC 23026]
MWLQAHVGFWTLALVLFVISLFLRGTALKVFHMILRLMYVLIIITGLYLLFHVFSLYGIWVIIKMICGLGVIVTMEMLLVRRKKQASTGVIWVLLIIFLALVFYIGYGKLG